MILLEKNCALVGCLLNVNVCFNYYVAKDILLLVFQHIRTIQLVSQLLYGHRDDDKKYRTEFDDKKAYQNADADNLKQEQSRNLDAKKADRDESVKRACCCAAGVACCNCCYRAIDRVDGVLQNMPSIVLKLYALAVRLFLATTALVVFVMGVYILSEIVASTVTMQV